MGKSIESGVVLEIFQNSVSGIVGTTDYLMMVCDSYTKASAKFVLNETLNGGRLLMIDDTTERQVTNDLYTCM